MQDVFEEDQDGQPQSGETQPTEQPQTDPGQQQPQEGAQQPAEGEAATPPVADTRRHVPLEALEAVRGERNDWKSEAIRAKEEAKQLRERYERPQQQDGQQQFQMPQLPQSDPLWKVQQRDPELATSLYIDRLQRIDDKFNTSEMLVREKFSDVDEVVAVFYEAAARNPALATQMHASRSPWKFAYDEGKRLKFASEIGNDPEAYRKKVRAEVEAELKAQTPAAGQSATPAAPHLPQSLADARSAGARGTTFTGPTPLDNLFPN